MNLKSPYRNNWNPKPPFKNNRRICPNDIPYTKPLTYWYVFANGDRDIDKYWVQNTINPIIDSNASYTECSRRLRQFHNIVNREDHIIQTSSRYTVGIYSNDLEIHRVHPELVQFNYTKGTYKLFEPIYYVTYKNKVHFVKESNLKTLMENMKDRPIIKEIGYCSAEDLKFWTTRVKIRVAFNSKDRKWGPKQVLDFLNDPNRYNTLKDFGFNIGPDNKKWKIYWEKEINLTEYQHFYNQPRLQSCWESNNHTNKVPTLIIYVPYRKIKLHKIHPENSAISRRNRISHRSKQRNEYAKMMSYNPSAGKLTYIQIGLGPIRGVPASQADKLIEKHDHIHICTLKEYTNYIAFRYGKMCRKVIDGKKVLVRKEPKYTTMHKDGNRKQRNHHKTTKGNTDIRGIHVKVTEQIVPMPIVTTDKEGNIIYTKDTIRNKHGQKFNPTFTGEKFITKSTITGSKTIIGRKNNRAIIADNEPMKRILRVEGVTKKGDLLPIYTKTRHNAKPNPREELKEARRNFKKKCSWDPRYTKANGGLFTDRIFWEILKMINNKERHPRHKKILKYVKNALNCSTEHAEIIIKYLRMTRHGDPTITHTKSDTRRIEKQVVTKDHLLIKLPYPFKDTVIIQHEFSNKDTGKIETRITGETYMNYQNNFFKQDEEKKQVFINKARNVFKWMLQEEYNKSISNMSIDDIKKFNESSEGWQKVAIPSTKNVTKIVKTYKKLPKKSSAIVHKKWKTPMKDVNKLVDKRIETLQKLKGIALFNYIRHIIIPSQLKGSGSYSLLVDKLYQQHIKYSKELSSYILKRTDEEEWIRFADAIVGVPFS
jgi:hypothetical protein